MQQVFTGQENSSIQGIYWLGNRFVNWFIIDTTHGLTVVDAGFPGHWQKLVKGVAAVDRQLSDVKAIILTHAHTDHIGFAEHARQQTGAEVWIHEVDAEAARNGHNEPPPPPILRNLWRPRILISMVSALLFEGALKDNAIKNVSTFQDGAVLPVPGQPHAIHVPGHTMGSVAFYLPEVGVLFSGDEICTADPSTAKQTPPSIIKHPLSYDESLARNSLTKLEKLGKVLMLPGHGNPWRGDMMQAVAVAKNAESVQAVHMDLSDATTG